MNSVSLLRQKLGCKTYFDIGSVESNIEHMVVKKMKRGELGNQDPLSVVFGIQVWIREQRRELNEALFIDCTLGILFDDLLRWHEGETRLAMPVVRVPNPKRLIRVISAPNEHTLVEFYLFSILNIRCDQFVSNGHRILT